MKIYVNVRDRIATAEGNPVIICGNSGYVIHFSFDEEWDEYDIKIARFAYWRDGTSHFEDVPFAGTSVAVPAFSNIYGVQVGVYAGNLHTSTGAKIDCRRSILCTDPTPAEPPEDVYEKVKDMLDTAVFIHVDGQDYSMPNMSEPEQTKEENTYSFEIL